ncbi:CYFA0S03e02520g1_1 [Cyberlindnera fabianii]|uniref:CYFA0S03e02520g1_1 n=1 Tax=Cyberlindnera fabianii TaxID=36022 RepID=A0A061AP79_CYBFA|nr:Uncharacterized protein MRP8 [Cyberlindnera fabianii]CDR39362.1 CYFA0S03e02520g1_1 [Cyberlindnera fabianii]
MSDVESLTKQIEELKLVVKKQSDLLTKTGEQVLRLQVSSTRGKIDAFDPSSVGGTPKQRRGKQLDTSDFATNEDLVQLVGELQGQLDVLEERAIRRLVNSKKTETELLAPLLSAYGEEPPLELFPRDIAAFEKIGDEDLVKLARFYELLPPTAEERAKFEEFVEGKDSQPAEVEVTASSFSKDELIEAFDTLSRFLGLSVRRGDDTW